MFEHSYLSSFMFKEPTKKGKCIYIALIIEKHNAANILIKQDKKLNEAIKRSNSVNCNVLPTLKSTSS